jgi:hypothetical protein
MRRIAAIIGFIALLLVSALASASNGFLSENSRRKKNLGQAGIHRDFSDLNAEFHWVCVNYCPKHAANLFVAPKSNLRQLYTDEVAGLEKAGQDLLASGKSEAEVAKILHQMRRDLGVKYKEMTPSDLLEYIYKFNEARYGDKLGPTFELLKQQGKTDAQIIASASRPLGDVKQLGSALYKQFGEEIAPILRKYGMLD